MDVSTFEKVKWIKNSSGKRKGNFKEYTKQAKEYEKENPTDGKKIREKAEKPSLQDKQGIISTIKKIDSNITQINNNAIKIHEWLNDQ